jgi:ribonuclease HII
MFINKQKPTFEIENKYNREMIYGVDEAGLGAWAGPIVFAVCHIDRNIVDHHIIEKIDDSKRLTRYSREKLFGQLVATAGIIYNIAMIHNDHIDKVGIAQAWRDGVLAVVHAISGAIFLLDGSRSITNSQHRIISIVKGDQKSLSIAAASIIAKVTRDNLMQQEIHPMYPKYAFDKHVGYGTQQHHDALKTYGPCLLHRKSFKPVACYRENNAN